MTQLWYMTLCHLKMHRHTQLENPSSNIIKHAPDTIILITRSEFKVKVTVTQKMVCDTPPSQEAFTHQLWNSILIEYRRYAPDSMQFLQTRSEVKFKVTVTQLWYATLRHSKTHPHTKFEIPTSNNIRDMLRTRLF